MSNQVNLTSSNDSEIRHNWTIKEVQALFELPFNDLMFQAQSIHRQHFNPNEVQVSTLLSIKTGACPEDCKYCSQSARYKTDIDKERLMEVDKVLEAAKKQKKWDQLVSAWELRGVILKRVTCLMYLIWLKL